MIGFVSCSATKLPRPARAHLLYTSPMFKMSLAVALDRCEKVYILSAVHELVELDQVLKPYDRRLPSRKADRQVWVNRVASSIAHRHSRDEELLFMAGADYAQDLMTRLRTMDGHRCVDKATDRYEWTGWRGTIHWPLQGMGMGARLAWLSKESKAIEARNAWLTRKL